MAMITLLRVTLGLFLKDQWWYQYIGVMLYSYQVQIKGARIFGGGVGWGCWESWGWVAMILRYDSQQNYMQLTSTENCFARMCGKTP